MNPDPLWSMWLHPRQTVRALLDEDPNRFVVLLVCLGGIDQALSNASNRDLGDTAPLGLILGLALVLGPLGGLLGLWVTSHLLVWTGRWLQGAAPRAHLRTALAWSNVPSLPALVVWTLQVGLFGSDLFSKETPRAEGSLPAMLLFFGLLLVQIVLAVWSFVLLCQAVAEAQGFRSAWRGLANLLLAGLALFVPVVVLVLIVTGLMSALRPAV